MAINDEPVVTDGLGHHALARSVGHRVLKCHPPYVMGICGSWGAGKTSFLLKLRVYLGGEFRLPDEDTATLTEKEKKNEEEMSERREQRLEKWFEESRLRFREILDGRELELVWFNPWQHQFESSPMVALLNEIRQHFTLKKKLMDDAGRVGNIALHATLKAIGEAAKGLKIPLPSVQGYAESRREYEADNFSASLTSQRFRELFEQAISEITNGKGLLVVFIDDLDRCEGDVAYRLLEALKLYLNAKNCVFVLGLDQQQLENAIAKAFSGDKEDRARFRPMARDYLSKMFQGLFLLPVPRQAETYVEDLLDFNDDDFNRLLKRLFEFTEQDRRRLIQALDQNLPHNPRKIKSFINSWKLYLESLPANTTQLDWRLTVILHYLAQFEEPLFRKVEESPTFYNEEVIPFCRNGFSDSWRFDGLRLPYGLSSATVETPPPIEDESGGSTPVAPSVKSELSEAEKKEKRDREIAAGKWHPGERMFWIGRLITQMEGVGLVSEERILRHLLHTGAPWQPAENAE